MRHITGNDKFEFLCPLKPQERTDILFHFPQTDFCIHHVGLLVQPVDFQLQHLVLGDGAYFVAPLCHAEERVGRSMVLECCGEFVLC